MKRFLILILAGLLLLEAQAQKIKVTFLQINDVYEIAPVRGGNTGGFARLTTIRNGLVRKNPNTVTVLSGDFLSPSVFNQTAYQNGRVYGAQMIEAMNSVPIDYVTFGNHEFDIPEADLLKRINESQFQWIATNTRHVNTAAGGTIEPFAKEVSGKKEPLPEYKILTFEDKSRNLFRLGMMGLTIPYNKAKHVNYEEVIPAAQRVFSQIKDSCDAVVSMTHQYIYEDEALAKALPDLKLLMGGHEHTNNKKLIGNTVITKADANATTVYVHHLTYNVKKKTLKIKSKLLPVNKKIQDDRRTAEIVNKWTELAYSTFRAKGFEPTEVVYQTTEVLEATEAVIRKEPTNMGKLIAEAMHAVGDGADLALFNAGSVRVDDILTDKITQYDILRTLPYGGPIVQAEVKGSVLRQLLEAGEKNKGTGGYLQTMNVRYDAPRNQWYIKEEPLTEYRNYRLLVSEYVFLGKETNMEFFNKNNPDVKEVTENSDPAKAELRKDIRKVVLQYLKAKTRN